MTKTSCTEWQLDCWSCFQLLPGALQVSNCSAGITNPVAQESDIATMSVLRFTFDIYTTTNLATDASCTVGLINSLVTFQHNAVLHMMSIM